MAAIPGTACVIRRDSYGYLEVLMGGVRKGYYRLLPQGMPSTDYEFMIDQVSGVGSGNSWSNYISSWTTCAALNSAATQIMMYFELYRTTGEGPGYEEANVRFRLSVRNKSNHSDAVSGYITLNPRLDVSVAEPTVQPWSGSHRIFAANGQVGASVGGVLMLRFNSGGDWELMETVNQSTRVKEAGNWLPAGRSYTEFQFKRAIIEPSVEAGGNMTSSYQAIAPGQSRNVMLSFWDTSSGSMQPVGKDESVTFRVFIKDTANAKEVSGDISFEIEIFS